MENIRNTAAIVKDILEDDAAARNSDMLLYIKVCERVNPAVLQSPFASVISSLKACGLPAFETVRRTRQKVQADCPELASNARVTAARAIREAEFREYAREG